MTAPSRRAAAGVALAALVLTIAACGPGPEPEPVPPATTGATSAPTSEPPSDLRTVLHVDFDQPGAAGALAEGAPVPAADGGPVGAVRLGGGTPVPPTLDTGAEGAGLRLATPCDPTTDCPKAVVEFPDSADLNPGTRDFRYGASVLMAPDETSKGSNVLQKGFNNGGGSQWKLQVDGEKGRASCVLVGTDPAHDWSVTGTASVADGDWHVLECRREGGTLSLLVDGELDRSKQIDPATDVAPQSPLRVGGKSVKPDNDQFLGVLDDVVVQVGP